MTKCWVIDLDGVMWRGVAPIPGSGDAAQRLVDGGHRVVFCTNHATGPESKAERLRDLGVKHPHVLTSAEVAASVCGPGRKVLALGEPSLTEVLRSAGVDAIDVGDLPVDGPVPEVEVVVVGACSHWDRSLTGLAADAIRAGARFVATNDDPTYPYTGLGGPRLLPGAGALVAAVSVTAGVQPEVVGKPHRPTADLIGERYGAVDVVVGDRTDTDGGLADALGATFALVLSGTTKRDEIPDSDGMPNAQSPDLIGVDLADLVDQVLAGSVVI